MEKALLVFLAKHLASGAAGGVSCGLGLLTFDVANLRTLIVGSDDMALATFMLFFGLGATFAATALAAGIMGLGRSDDR
jgi:hypothetical protein